MSRPVTITRHIGHNTVTFISQSIVVNVFCFQHGTINTHCSKLPDCRTVYATANSLAFTEYELRMLYFLGDARDRLMAIVH